MIRQNLSTLWDTWDDWLTHRLEAWAARKPFRYEFDGALEDIVQAIPRLGHFVDYADGDARLNFVPDQNLYQLVFFLYHNANPKGIYIRKPRTIVIAQVVAQVSQGPSAPVVIEGNAEIVTAPLKIPVQVITLICAVMIVGLLGMAVVRDWKYVFGIALVLGFAKYNFMLTSLYPITYREWALMGIKKLLIALEQSSEDPQQAELARKPMKLVTYFDTRTHKRQD